MVLSPTPPSPSGLGNLTPVLGSPGNPVISPAVSETPAGPGNPPVVSDVDTISMVVGQPAVDGAGPAPTGSGTASPDPPGGQTSQTFRSGTGGVSISGGGGRPVTTQQPGSTAGTPSPGTPSPPNFPRSASGLQHLPALTLCQLICWILADHQCLSSHSPRHQCTARLATSAPSISHALQSAVSKSSVHYAAHEKTAEPWHPHKQRAHKLAIVHVVSPTYQACGYQTAYEQHENQYTCDLTHGISTGTSFL